MAINTQQGQQSYNAPSYNGTGTQSTIDSNTGQQIRVDYYWKKALVEAAREQYFTQLADVKSMPRNMGKTIKKYHYLPLLDDGNVNSQGIDAAGVTIVQGTWSAWDASGDLVGSAYSDEAAAWAAAGASFVNENGGNLYGTSKDVGVISKKLPALTEFGGRVNRVGFSRKVIEGTIEKFGFYSEFTQESLDFDTDEELYSHMSSETIKGANEITEDALQVDLLNGAGVVSFTGSATSLLTLNPEAGTDSVVTYDDLVRLDITLDENRTPKQTKVISGSRMTDTKTVSDGRVMYIGTEMIPTVRKMTDYFNNEAFVPVHQYAAAATPLRGEIGSVGPFRLIVVPEMQSRMGAGAEVTTNPGYRATDDNYDAYPMLVVGDGSFTTIGFNTDGKTVKFKMYTKMPGSATADRNDPYGETGFNSIKWYYGSMILRAERLAVIWSCAEQ